MTIGELERALESKRRVRKIEAQERASYDYILANLIYRSMARLYSSTATMPEINTIYSTLFDDENISETIAENKARLSALRFKQFVEAHNKKFKEQQGGKIVNE